MRRRSPAFGKPSRVAAALIVATAAACLGCGQPAPPEMQGLAPAPPPAQETTAAPTPEPPPSAEPAPGTVRESATAMAAQGQGSGGVTGKGNYKPGLITTPISVYFRAQERILFDQVKHALNLYKAEHGRVPRTHEDFMRDVIAANNLNLPELPEHYRYVFDLEKEELLVEHPGP
jgi:hypothetical protein